MFFSLSNDTFLPVYTCTLSKHKQRPQMGIFNFRKYNEKGLDKTKEIAYTGSSTKVKTT
jgi:hypothetical protein